MLNIFFHPPTRRNNFEIATHFPALILKRDNWDDYGYKLSYEVYYLKDNVSNSEYFGAVKILKLSHDQNIYAYESIIPNNLQTLSPEFGSFGQGIGYYKTIMEKGEPFVNDYAYAMSDLLLRDKAYPSLPPFPLEMDHDAITKGLTRDSDSLKRLLADQGEGLSAYIGGLRFSFITTLPNATEPHHIDFNFPSNTPIPCRINVLIGKNGTGKTQILCELIKKVLGLSERNTLKPNKIIFDSIIAISYSIFDDFPKNNEAPINTSIGSYFNCGFRPESLGSGIKDRFFNAVSTISIQHHDESTWFLEFMHSVFLTLGETYHHKTYIPMKYEELIRRGVPEAAYTRNAFYDWMCDTFENLSSGGKIVTLILAEIYSLIIDHSIVILDEPETHLHPGLLSHFLSFFQELLERKESYAIIATHSPIVLQSISRHSVHVIERYGNIPKISPLAEECFGESLGKIFSSVLSLDTHERDYHQILQKALLDVSPDEIMEFFKNDIGMGAYMHLISQNNIGDE